MTPSQAVLEIVSRCRNQGEAAELLSISQAHVSRLSSGERGKRLGRPLARRILSLLAQLRKRDGVKRAVPREFA